MKIIYHNYGKVSSTQEIAKELNPADNEFHIISAGQQTDGRGRLERKWHSAKGGLWFSAVFIPPAALNRPETATHFSVIACIACAESIRKLYKIPVELKWPNDLVIQNNGRYGKLAGILAETVIHGGVLKRVVIGIGININNIIPGNLKEIAVSLKQITGREHSPDRLLKEISSSLASIIGSYEKKKSAVRKKYEAWSALHNNTIVLEQNGNKLSGAFSGFSADYSLIIRDRLGARNEFGCGEIEKCYLRRI